MAQEDRRSVALPYRPQLPSGYGYLPFFHAQPVRFLADPSAWTIVDAFIDLTIGDQANGEGFISQASGEITCCWCSFECIHDPHAIDQITRNAGRGLVEMRRLWAFAALSCSVS